ncbi:MAG: hypothetical protein Q9167_001764 [Letrouitia subvulpina]
MEYLWPSSLQLLDGSPIESPRVKASSSLDLVSSLDQLPWASCAVVYTVGLALVVDTVSRDRVGAWMGFALSGMNNGVMIGPLLGGFIYVKAGYYVVFVVVLAVIAADAVLRLTMVEKKGANKCVKESGEENGYGTFSADDGNTTHNLFIGPRVPGQGSFNDSLESESEIARDYKITYLAGPNGEDDVLVSKDQKPKATNTHSSARYYVSRIGTTAILTPLAADMFHVVEAMSTEHETLFGQNGAYAQAYGLFDLALALGQMLGPIFGGFVYEKWGWATAAWSLAAFSASGVIPIVKIPFLERSSHGGSTNSLCESFVSHLMRSKYKLNSTVAITTSSSLELSAR